MGRAILVASLAQLANVGDKHHEQLPHIGHLLRMRFRKAGFTLG
jgi:hypothetical protein